MPMRLTPLSIVFLTLLAGLVATTAFAGDPDTDGDLVPDPIDNCLLIPNPSQTDTDVDGIGNICDADYTQDGIVGGPDFSVFIASWGTRVGDAGFDARADANDDGVIGGPDYSYYAMQYQNASSPGPSGLPCAEPPGTRTTGGPCTP